MKIRRVFRYVKMKIEKQRVLSGISAGRIPAYWWTGEKNFGDLVTPYLIQKLTGRTAVNARGLDLGEVDVLYSTGSILNAMQSGNYTVWGSGFIKPVESSLARTNVHALRGPLSGQLANKLGWDNPNKYGDPALLLPLFVAADDGGDTRPSNPGIVVVPHHAWLSATSTTHPGIHIVSPMQDVEVVVRHIRDASLVISSSLHGIIVAQAYGRPWVWWRDNRGLLHGGDFKFEDFFSSIEVSPPCIECNGEITSRLVDKAITMATLAPHAVTQQRQRDLLSNAPRILDTPVLAGRLMAVGTGPLGIGAAPLHTMDP